MKLRTIRSLAIFAAILVATVPGPSHNAAANNEIQVYGKLLPLNPDDSLQVDIGRLRYRGGVEITSDSILFGGLSGLDVINPKGENLIAISDNGRWISIELKYDDQGDLAGVGKATMQKIEAPDGFPKKGSWRDAEAIAPDGNGGYFVAFERQHRIWHYRTPKRDPFNAIPIPLKAPDDVALQPNNGGIEAMARLCDRRLLAISEKARKSENGVKAWVFDGKQWKSLVYGTTGNFDPTGAAVLPDCNLVVLERSFSPAEGVRGRVVIVPAKTIRPGATLRGEEVASFEAPLTIDNMEGIAARRGKGGSTLLYLVSDDNFSGFQRTILMMFELVPPPKTQ